MRRISLITARICALAAIKNTSSSASITVSPCGMIARLRRKIAATRVSTFGMCSRNWRSCLPTSGARPRGNRATALYGTNIWAVAEVAQTVTVGVDHGDVVGFAGQVFRQGAANLACTENDDLHAVCSSAARSGSDFHQLGIVEAVVAVDLRE